MAIAGLKSRTITKKSFRANTPAVRRAVWEEKATAATMTEKGVGQFDRNR
jgi:hypothetical protein